MVASGLQPAGGPALDGFTVGGFALDGFAAARSAAGRSAFYVERSVELRSVGPQPAPLGHVIRDPARDQRPEARAVAEDAEVRQLVDGHRLQDSGRREHEPPRERDPAGPRRAPPSAARIAHGDAGGRHAQCRRVARDRSVQRIPRADPQPRLEDRRERASFGRRKRDDQLVFFVPADTLDVGSAATRRAGHCAHSVRLTPVAEQRAVADRPGRSDSGSCRCLAGHVPAQPRFALREERLDERACPRLRGSDARDRGDHAAARIDRHPEPLRPGRSPERVFEVATGQPCTGGRLDRGVAAVGRAGCHREDRATGGGPAAAWPAALGARVGARSHCVFPPMGLQLWLDRSDRGQLYGVRRLGEIPGVVDTLPVQFTPEMVRRIERIDVLWLRDEAIIAAFEVEATTAVYAGLLRMMADLLALSPNLNIPLFIVAPEERRGKVREEISRPTFSRALRKPLARSCRYISFSRLREDAARLGTYVRVVKPEEFVEALSESFDNGA